MNHSTPIIALALAALSGSALATEYGTVVSSTPITLQVPVPRQACSDASVQAPTTGGGALLGAVIGGAIGNSLGSGAGRAAATGLGLVAGAAIGNQAEAANTPPATLRNCQTLMRYEPRVVGYDITYEYQGQRYATRVAQDPGRRIALNVSADAAGAPALAPSAQAVQAPPAPAAYGPAVYASAVYGAPVYGYYGYGGPVVSVAPILVLGSWGRHWR